MIPTISCPGCNVSLKNPADLPAGKRIQCPHCGTAFAPTADAAAGVTTMFHPGADTSPSAAPLSRRTQPADGKRRASEPPKRFNIGALLAALALVFVVLLGGSAIAVLAYFGKDWYAPSKSTESLASQKPTKQDMGNQPIRRPIDPRANQPGPAPGIFGPGPRRPGQPVQPRPRMPVVQPNQPAAESIIGVYRMRLAKELVPQKLAPDQGRQTFAWKHSTVFSGTTRIEVTLLPAGADKPEDALGAILASVPCLRQGLNCSAVQRSQINGLIFQRVNWSGVERDVKRPMSGFVFTARDGDTRIQIVGYSTETNRASLSLADAAVLTFRKAPK